MIEIINFTTGNTVHTYPKFQAEGFAAQYAFPFAKKMCNGLGLDVGCNRPEWKLPGAYAVDPALNQWSADDLPKNEHAGSAGKWDYIFSSHMLEHYPGSWGQLLNYWRDNLVKGGVLFLYLPGPGQHYWKNWHNAKHVHNLTPDMLREYFQQNGYLRHWVTGEDLNNSFYAVGQL